MLTKHIALTIVTGGAFAEIARRNAPARWTVIPVIGLILLASGFVLWTIARFQLGASFTVKAEARELVTHGLYSRIRNPVYVFGSFAIAGLILLVGRPLWLLVFAAIIPLQVLRARKEAQVLESKFGEQYRAYRAGTWF